MWVAVWVAVLGAMGNNIGKALQKRGVGGLPRLRLERAILRQYLLNTTYSAGLALDISGALANVVALANAPVSVIQPLMSSGLAILAVFSHFYLDEKLVRHEWIAVAVTGVGILGLGMSSEEEAENLQIHTFRILLSAVICISILVANTVLLRNKSRQPRSYGAHSPAPQRELNIEEILTGVQSGLCFGLSASTCRTGFLLAKVTQAWWLGVVGLGMSVALTSTGLLIQTEGLKDGRSVVVCTCTEATLMITALVYGTYALGETLPEAQSMRLLRYGSWIFMIVGITGLSYKSHSAKAFHGSGGGAKGLQVRPASQHRQLSSRAPDLLPFRFKPAKDVSDD